MELSKTLKAFHYKRYRVMTGLLSYSKIVNTCNQSLIWSDFTGFHISVNT